MRRRLERRGAAAIGLVVALLGLQLAVGVAPASADEGTAIEFTTPSPVQVAFGENWVLRATTNAVYLDGAFPGFPGLGTVDVFVSGIDEPFATALPIQEDGAVYITQPAARPILPAGEYQVTAVLHASSGSGLTDSQTSAPVVLTVTAYGVDASVSVEPLALGDEPVLAARLAGEFVDETGGAPGGTWTFAVSAAGDTVVEAEVAQEPGTSEPLRYPITEKLEEGAEYTVVSTFTPVEALAGGVEVQQPADTTFRMPTSSIGDTLGAPIPFPLWLLILCSALVVGLITTAIILTVKAAGPRSAVAAEAPVTAPTEEFVQVEDLFPLQNAAAAPQQWNPAAATPTVQLPTDGTPTTKLPTDGTPTTQTPAEGTPTELLDPNDRV